MTRMWLMSFVPVLVCLLATVGAQEIKSCKESDTVQEAKIKNRVWFQINLNSSSEFEIGFYGKVKNASFIEVNQEGYTVTKISKRLFKVSGITKSNVTVRWRGRAKLRSVKFGQFQCLNNPCPNFPDPKICDVLETEFANGQPTSFDISSNFKLRRYQLVLGFDKANTLSLGGDHKELKSRCTNLHRYRIKNKTIFNATLDSNDEAVTRMTYLLLVANKNCKLVCGKRPKCIKKPKTTLPPVRTTTEVPTTTKASPTTTEALVTTTTEEPEPPTEDGEDKRRVSGEINSLAKQIEQLKDDLKEWRAQ